MEVAVGRFSVKYKESSSANAPPSEWPIWIGFDQDLWGFQQRKAYNGDVLRVFRVHQVLYLCKYF